MSAAGCCPATRPISTRRALSYRRTFLYRRGRPNDDLFNFIRANVRVPDIVVGDFMAQMTANRVVKDRVLEFLKDTELGDLEALGTEFLTRSERAMRQVIESLPRGSYHGEVEADGDEAPITIKTRINIEDGGISVDFDGTSGQSSRGINVTFNWTYADVIYALLCALRPASPINAGSLKPLRVSAPKGCILNAQYPAAVGARVLVAHHVQAAIFRALESILPDNVIADSAAPTWVPVLSGVNQYGERFVEILIVHGGIGARPTKDGMVVSYPDHPPTTAVEIFENEKPILIERKEFIPDTAGPGRHRGGFGQYFCFRLLGDKPLRVGMRADRIYHPPLGFAAAVPAVSARRRSTTKRRYIPSALSSSSRATWSTCRPRAAAGSSIRAPETPPPWPAISTTSWSRPRRRGQSMDSRID